MEWVSVPAVVMRKYSGCILASPEPLVMTSNNFLFGCVCSSSNTTPWMLKPCLEYASAESTW